MTDEDSDTAHESDETIVIAMLVVVALCALMWLGGCVIGAQA